MSDPVAFKETSETMRVLEEESVPAPEVQTPPTSSDGKEHPELDKEESCQEEQKEMQVTPPPPPALHPKFSSHLTHPRSCIQPMQPEE